VPRFYPRRVYCFCYLPLTVFWPALVISIMPIPHSHLILQLSIKAGWPFTSTLFLPPVQDDMITGVQGISCNFPFAAVVAAATVGLARDLHFPKGVMFITNLLSLIFAMGRPCKHTGFMGCVTPKAGCAEPIEHFNFAPLHT
jgi:hypothetical protein